MKIEQKLLTKNPMSRPGTKIGSIIGIVIHYVGNPGSSALANRNYFENLKNQKEIYASSHYIIGLNGEIIQCVPENEISYHAKSANMNYIGIECCHPKSDGKFNNETRESLINLSADILRRYNKKRIIRHYDEPSANGKKCPIYYVNNPTEWNKLVNDILIATDPPIISEIDKAIDSLAAAGIINSPEYWKNIKIEFLPELALKALPNINKNISNGIIDINEAFGILSNAGIINSKAYWENQVKSIKYLDQLIINIANNIKK